MSQIPPSAPATTQNRPRVGVAVFILRPSTTTTTTTSTSTTSSSTSLEFILGQRLGSHGSGTHALPGGHLEYSESFADCAARETLEETGLTIHNIRFLTATNDVFEREGKHYITIFVCAEIADDGKEPVVLEPEKCAGWEWVSWEDVEKGVNGDAREGEKGKELFLPLVNLVRQRPGIVPLLL